MEYLKRRAAESAAKSGGPGWSILKRKGDEAPPDPPWLVAAKQRSEERAKRNAGKTREWWQSPYEDGGPLSFLKKRSGPPPAPDAAQDGPEAEDADSDSAAGDSGDA